MNLKEIREIIKLMDENEIREFEMERDGVRLKLSRGYQAVQEIVPVKSVVAEPVNVAASTASEEPTSSAVEMKKEEGLEDIVSPMVGTFYTAPSPDSPPYAKEGDRVSIDDVVCIVEAMKVMNEIKAEVSGVIAEIMVENGQSVEYGQPLFRVRKA
ncbi:MAG: acetyl-CoA carboxylase biotin carboxyl carrier protein [Candidatus Theseobacter exili]|nr:acetyl-CoA carboxylase biotin carboxyl carrier protein [Candidatus Theseobacter exili]